MSTLMMQKYSIITALVLVCLILDTPSTLIPFDFTGTIFTVLSPDGNGLLCIYGYGCPASSVSVKEET
jgi:hypothetical protein